MVINPPEYTSSNLSFREKPIMGHSFINLNQ